MREAEREWNRRGRGVKETWEGSRRGVGGE